MYKLIDPASATGVTKELLDSTQKQLGRVPNLYRAMANSSISLNAYLSFRGALQGGELDTKMCERIALLTAERNDCDYCVAAHSFRGAKLGMSASELHDTRLGRSEDEKIQAALNFVIALMDGHGHVSEHIQAAMFAKGWNEAQVAEMVAHVALNMFSNYFFFVISFYFFCSFIPTCNIPGCIYHKNGVVFDILNN